MNWTNLSYENQNQKYRRLIVPRQWWIEPTNSAKQNHKGIPLPNNDATLFVVQSVWLLHLQFKLSAITTASLPRSRPVILFEVFLHCKLKYFDIIQNSPIWIQYNYFFWQIICFADSWNNQRTCSKFWWTCSKSKLFQFNHFFKKKTNIRIV